MDTGQSNVFQSWAPEATPAGLEVLDFPARVSAACEAANESRSTAGSQAGAQDTASHQVKLPVLLHSWI